MGIPRGPRQVMRWQSTLAAMIEYGTVAICVCKHCDAKAEPVDLEAMAKLLGRDGSLWDRQPPCEAGDCEGLRHFMCSPGPGSPMRPMTSTGPWYWLENLPAEAWMGGWTGWEGPHPPSAVR